MASMSPLIGMLSQESPEYKRRMLASQMLMQQGPAQNPSRSPIEGALRMLTQIAGGFVANRAMAKDEAQRAEAGKLLSDAMTQPTNAPAGGGHEALIARLSESGSPDAQQMARGLSPEAGNLLNPQQGTTSGPMGRDALIARLSGSNNPYAQQLGQGLTAMRLLQPGAETTPESFGTPQTVMGPEGKPMLAQFGNRGTARPVEGFSPTPDEKTVAAAKPMHLGGGVLYDPATGNVTTVDEVQQRELALRQAGAARTSVNVGAPTFTFPRPETEKAADTAFGKGMGEMAGTLVQSAPQRSQEMSKVNATESLLNHLETVGKEPGKFADVKNEMARSYYSLTGQKVPENIQDFRTFSSMANKDILNYIGAKQGGIPASGFSDRDMQVVKSIAASSADDPLTLKAKLAVQKATIKADDAFAKDIMDYRKTMPTEEATYKAMENAKSRDFLSNDPAVKRWAQTSAPPAAATGAPSVGPKKWRLQGGKLVPE